MLTLVLTMILHCNDVKVLTIILHCNDGNFYAYMQLASAIATHDNLVTYVTGHILQNKILLQHKLINHQIQHYIMIARSLLDLNKISLNIKFVC